MRNLIFAMFMKKASKEEKEKRKKLSNLSTFVLSPAMVP